MRIKNLLLFFAFFFFQSPSYAADLLDVYRQALTCDPTYQQAIAQRLATREGVPIAFSAILPQILLNINPTVTRTGLSGTFLSTIAGAPFTPRNNTTRGYTMTLTLSQTIFDFAKFARVQGARALAIGAEATLNAELQNLMVRVSQAYFAILRDEDNVRFSKASKVAFAEQLDQVTQQYKVGLKTITDVYTAQASYDSASADLIAAQTELVKDRENLRVITGKYYPHLSKLSEKFPLITPKPANINEWVDVSANQNWTVRAARYNVENMRQIIKQQIAGHLPTIDLQGKMDRIFVDNINSYNTSTSRNGPGSQTDRQIGLNINVPIFSGGGVVAQTNQAIYNYEAAQQQMEKALRDALNVARQSYMSIIAGVSKIKADKLAVRSSILSLQGMEESYRVGTETLVNVLNQQQRVYQQQLRYAADRYKFVVDIMTLKQAAGILSFEDMCGVNVWLTDKVQKAITDYTPHRRHAT